MTGLGRKKALVYCAVLAAAVVCLLFDRIYYQPSVAGAEPAPPPPEPAAAAPQSDAKSLALAPAGPPLASVFQGEHLPPAGRKGPPGSSADNPIRDAFSTSPAMAEHYQTLSQQQQKDEVIKEVQEQEQQKIQLLETFRQSHQLKATCAQGASSWAVVDERVMSVGDRLDGFVLRRIEHYRAVFQKNEELVDLSLPVPAESKVPASKPR